MAANMESILGELRSLARQKVEVVDAEGARHREWLRGAAARTKSALESLRESQAQAVAPRDAAKAAQKDGGADKENAGAGAGGRRAARAARRGAGQAPDAHVAALAAMGHDDASARRALASCAGDLQVRGPPVGSERVRRRLARPRAKWAARTASRGSATAQRGGRPPA